jgi:hypothetical protein
VYPTKRLLDKGFVAEDNVLVGNTCMYGATSGKAFLRGKVRTVPEELSFIQHFYYTFILCVACHRR